MPKIDLSAAIKMKGFGGEIIRLKGSGFSWARPSTDIWSPNNLPHIRAWYDATDPSTITHSLNSVSEWRDKSINSVIFSQSTETNKPLYDPAGGRIDFTDGWLEATTNLGMTGNPAMQVAAVVENDADQYGIARFFQIGRGDFSNCCSSGTAGYSWRHNNGANIFSPDPVVGLKSVVFFQRPHGSSYVDGLMFLNGVEQSISSSNKSSRSPNITDQFSVIGSGQGGNLNPDLSNARFGGKISEIVISESSTTSDRHAVEGYLAHRHGTQGLLPAGHPYKTSPP